MPRPEMDKEPDPLLNLSDSDLARQKAVFELRKLQRETTLIGRLLATAPGLVSLAVSFVSIMIASSTFFLQSQRAKEDIDAAQAKQFADLIQAAADSKRGAGERIAAIWLLQRYWQKPERERTDVLANALCGIIADEGDVSVMAACSEVIGHAYNKDTPRLIRQSLKIVLFGEWEGMRTRPLGAPTGPQDYLVGAILRTLNLISAKATPDGKSNELVEERTKFLCQAIEGCREDLQGVLFSEAHLAGIDLSGAFLAQANFAGADLTGARFYRADLREASFQDANLENAVLYQAHLEGANLTGANLKKADLSRAHLEGAQLPRNLIDAQLEGAHLKGVDLSNAQLERANLQRSDLEGADLQNANLDGAHLQGADLTKTNLKGAKFVKADFTGTKLDGADLDGATVGDQNALKDALGTFQGKFRVESGE